MKLCTKDFPSVSFEVQIRTQLQHLWSVASFALFHKTDKIEARKKCGLLNDLASSLNACEALVSSLETSGNQSVLDRELSVDEVNKFPIVGLVYLFVIHSEEKFFSHQSIQLSQDFAVDHQNIVKAKLRLYKENPGAAVVECRSMDISSYSYNEPHVRFPFDRVALINW